MAKASSKFSTLAVAKLNAKTPQAMSETRASTMAGIFMAARWSPRSSFAGTGDDRADQFASGVMLYELAVGSNPFKRDTFPQTTAATLEAKTKPQQEKFQEQSA